VTPVGSLQVWQSVALIPRMDVTILPVNRSARKRTDREITVPHYDSPAR
jgi:hypothetical protein